MLVGSIPRVGAWVLLSALLECAGAPPPRAPATPPGSAIDLAPPAAAPHEGDGVEVWIGRLDDGAQRAAAVKHLLELAEEAKIKGEGGDLLAKIVVPLTQAYLVGGLEERTRIEVIQLLAE